jgi:hypothetical protein
MSTNKGSHSAAGHGQHGSHTTHAGSKVDKVEVHVDDGAGEADGGSADIVYDSQLGKEGFVAQEAAIRAVPTAELTKANVDPRRAAITALSVARNILSRKDVKARFALLHEKLFDPALLSSLEPLAWANWYIRTELLAAEAAASTAQLSPELVQEAQELQARMLELCVYHFGKQRRLGQELADMRTERSYVSQASHLTRLAAIYHGHHAVVARDPTNYRPTDEADANRVAHQIVDELSSQEQSVDAWADVGRRAYRLLNRTYDKILAAATFLFLEQPEILALFPSLVVTARAPRGSNAGTTTSTSSATTPAAASGGSGQPG